jgi:hypothetical protein
MYSWYRDTKDWKRPGAYEYKKNKSAYLDSMDEAAKKMGDRNYLNTGVPNMDLVDPKGKVIKSDSENVIIVAIDGTGSFKPWMKGVYDRVPLIYQTLVQYRPDVEVCFVSIGDATSDSYPLQINNFGKGLDLDAHVKALAPEGGGGGGIEESYELFAYFMLNCCEIPNAKNPILLLYGDEKGYPEISPAQVRKIIGKRPAQEIKSDEVWEALTEKFDLYFMQKPYGEGNKPMIDDAVNHYWSKTIGGQRVKKLFDNERAIDIGIGLIAKRWGEFGDFSKSIEARHDKETAKKVEHSIEFLPPEK